MSICPKKLSFLHFFLAHPLGINIKIGQEKFSDLKCLVEGLAAVLTDCAKICGFL